MGQPPTMKVAFILCLVLAVAAASPLDRAQALQLHALAELRVTQAAEQLAATGNAVCCHSRRWRFPNWASRSRRFHSWPICTLWPRWTMRPIRPLINFLIDLDSLD